MNQLHGRFRIANGDFLYVLSTFVFEPIRWNRRFGWRPMCEQERLGLFYFWREVGRRMGIKDLPADIDAFERFSHAYERERFRLTPANRRVGDATVNLFASWFPRPFSPMVRAGIYALLEDPVIEGFGFPRPAPCGALARTRAPAAAYARPRSKTVPHHQSAQCACRGPA
jgi:hypothetical protein